MRWVVIILIALITLVIAIFAAGAVLPRKHTASVMTRIAQPQQAVWQAINNHADDPKWRPELTNIQKLADRNGHALWLETYKDGMKLELEDVEVDAPKHFVREVRDTGNMFSGRWTIDITTNGDSACTVTITENGQVPNPFFRFMSRFVFGHTKSMEQYLTALGNKFGQTTKPTIVK